MSNFDVPPPKQPSPAPSSRSNSAQRAKRKLSREQYAYLRAEAKAPYRILRRFIYVAFAASGFIGALVFLAEVATGRDVTTALPNLGLQIGVLALMIWLLRVDKSS